jgi:CBS-domain-containing membrane protein
MFRDYAPLESHLLKAGAGYAQPTQAVAERVALDAPALDVMTDFEKVTAVIVLSGDTVEEAHRRMIQRAVRLLLVVDQDRRVVGVITAPDLLGEKPMRVVAQRGIRREELLVRDVMTPQEALEMLDYDAVRTSKVGHIVATLKRSGRQHALVSERRGGREVVRGVFSTTQIARQLGVAIPTGEVARTFSEIEAQLAR